MKRAAETQLTRESQAEEDQDSDQPAPWKKASDKELARRNIKPLPKRRGIASGASPTPESVLPPTTGPSTTGPLPPLSGLPSLGVPPSSSLPSIPKATSTGADFVFKFTKPSTALGQSAVATLTSDTTAKTPTPPSSSPSIVSGTQHTTAPSHTLPPFNFSTSSTSATPAVNNQTTSPRNIFSSFKSKFPSPTTGFKPPNGSATLSGDPEKGKKQPQTSVPFDDLELTNRKDKVLRATSPPLASGSGSKPKSTQRATSSAPKPQSSSDATSKAKGTRSKSPTRAEEEQTNEEGDDEEYADEDDFAQALPQNYNPYEEVDIDVGQYPETRPGMTEEHLRYNASYKYYISLRGLNNSFIRAAMELYIEDKFSDISQLFKHYRNYRKRVESDFLEWAKNIYGEEALEAEGFGHILDEDAKEEDEGRSNIFEIVDEEDEGAVDDHAMEAESDDRHEDAGMKPMEDAQAGAKDEPIVIDDSEDGDKTPPAQPRPVPSAKPPSGAFGKSNTFGISRSESPELQRNSKTPTPFAAKSPTSFTSKLPSPPPQDKAPPPVTQSPKPSTTAPVSTPFSFGNLGSGTASGSTGGAFTFGAKPSEAASIPAKAVSIEPSKPSHFSTAPGSGFGFSFSGKPTDISTNAPSSTSAPAPTPALTPASSSFSFGVPSSATAFSFGAKPTPAPSSDAPNPPEPTPQSSRGFAGFSTSSKHSVPKLAPPFGASSSSPSAPTTISSMTSTLSTGNSFGGFPGFGPITGGPAGSPFGTKALSSSSPDKSPAEAEKAKSPPASNVKPLGAWPGSTPEANKPGGLFGTFTSSASVGTGATSGFGLGFSSSVGASDKEKAKESEKQLPGEPFGTTAGASIFNKTTGPQLDPSSLPESERQKIGLPPIKSSSGDGLGADSTTISGETKKPDNVEDNATPKASQQSLPEGSPTKPRVGIANPWASSIDSSSSSTSSAPLAFPFGMGSKPPPSTGEPATNTGFSFATPPTGVKPPGTSGGFSFAEPPKGGGAFNPFASPPKAPILSGFGNAGAGGGMAPASGGISLSGSGTTPAFSFGKPGVLPTFGGTSAVARGPSFASSTSTESGPKLGSSQETVAAEPVGASGTTSANASGSSLTRLPQDGSTGSTGAGASQENDVAPEGGTGLGLGEDKYDQPGPGEENEESLFNVRGKIMKFSGSAWADLGIGQIRIYKHKETGSKRVFARNSKSGRILLNFSPFAKMEPKIDDTVPKFMRVTAMDNGKLVKILIKLKEAKDASDLVNALQREVDELS